jgi:hypothetical protein
LGVGMLVRLGGVEESVSCAGGITVTLLHVKHGESLKSRIKWIFLFSLHFFETFLILRKIQ